MVISVRFVIKTEHIQVLSHTTNHKNEHFAAITLKFGLANCYVTISYVCSHPSGLRHLAPGDHGDRHREPATPTRDAYIRDQSYTAQHYVIPRRRHGQVTMVPARPRTLLQSIVQTAMAGRRGPGLVSTSRNRSLRQL